MTWSQLIKIAMMGILRFDGKLMCEWDDICRVAKNKSLACEFKIKRNVFSHIWLYWTFLLGVFFIRSQHSHAMYRRFWQNMSWSTCIIAFDHMLHQLHLRFYWLYGIGAVRIHLHYINDRFPCLASKTIMKAPDTHPGFIRESFCCIYISFLKQKWSWNQFQT